MGKVAAENDEVAESREFNYPTYGIGSALRVAEAVKDLGGFKSAVSKPLLANKLKMQISPTFSQLLGAAKAYHLVAGNKEYTLTKHTKRYFHPTHAGEKRLAAIACLSAPTAFKNIIDRFDSQELPKAEILGNILLHHYGVPKSWAQRVAAIFISSAKELELIDTAGVLRYSATEQALARDGGAGNDDEPLNASMNATTTNAGNGANQATQTRNEYQPPAHGGGSSNARSVAVWTHPGGIRLETPDPFPRELWQKLTGYVALLEPSESNDT